MEVMGELTAQFLRFFGGMLRREMDTPGRVGSESQQQKCALFTCLDAAFGYVCLFGFFFFLFVLITFLCCLECENIRV
jgi:hypothetical protein